MNKPVKGIITFARAAFAWGLFASMALLCVTANAAENDILQKLECGLVSPNGSFALPIEKQKITILMIGSSSTSGVGAGSRSKAYPARTAFHLNAKANGPFFDVVAKGVGGERAKAAAQRMSTAIKQTAPDLIVWQVGTNDALTKVPHETLRQTLQEGLSIAKQHTLPLILIDPQFFPRILKHQHYDSTVELIAKIGEDHKLPVVRRYQRMKRALKLDQNSMTALLAKDRFHMSALGHECLARDLVATITKGAIASEVK